MQRRRSRAQRVTVMTTAAVAAATAGYLIGSLVAGYAVPVPALVVALLAGWLCIVALVAFPRFDDPASPAATVGVTVVDAARVAVIRDAGAAGRERDPVTGLPHYESTRDDGYVTRTDELAGSVIVVEIVDHVAASAIAPSVADRLVADAAARIATTGSTYGAVVRRLDGPRLLLLLPALDEAALTALASMLHDGAALGRAPGVALRDGSQPVRLVAGVAIADGEAVDVPTLVRSATTAAGQGKRQGNESPIVFHDGLADEARERLVVGRALRTAIDERNINVVYQPQLDLVDGSLLGVEVLARWRDPVLGTIRPDRFVEVAAEIGMSWQLDRLIFEKAFAQLGDWDAAGVAVPRLFLNVAPQNIALGRRIGIQDLMPAYGVDPDRITIEVVHSGQFDSAQGAAAVRHVRELGIHVTLDHFGAGETSFARLTELPVTGLKIDRALLAEDADRTALAAIIHAGTALGLSVAAVGIETTEQAERLRSLGCVAGQGYLYAQPLTADELVEWMRVPHLV